MTYTRGDNGPGVGCGSYLFEWSVKWQEILRGCARDGTEADSWYIYIYMPRMHKLTSLMLRTQRWSRTEDSFACFPYCQEFCLPGLFEFIFSLSSHGIKWGVWRTVAGRSASGWHVLLVMLTDFEYQVDPIVFALCASGSCWCVGAFILRYSPLSSRPLRSCRIWF